MEVRLGLVQDFPVTAASPTLDETIVPDPSPDVGVLAILAPDPPLHPLALEPPLPENTLILAPSASRVMVVGDGDSAGTEITSATLQDGIGVQL